MTQFHFGQTWRTSPGDDLTVASAAEVADLVDRVRAGDLEVTVNDLEGLLAVLRPALRAREALAAVDPTVLKSALELRTTRQFLDGAS